MCPVEKEEFERLIEMAAKIGFSDEEVADLVATYGCRDRRGRK